MVDIVVWDLQRSFKRTTDYGLVVPVASQGGYDINLLKPALVYNIPDKPTEPKIADIPQFVQLGIISKQEARLWLKEFGDVPIPEQMPPELMQQPQMPPMMEVSLVSNILGQQQTMIDPRMQPAWRRRMGMGTVSSRTGAKEPIARRQLADVSRHF